MAIHLNAEQKNLKRLLNEYETFVIPPYQRPYSWLVGECRQLYEDLIDAFNRPKKCANTIIYRCTYIFHIQIVIVFTSFNINRQRIQRKSLHSLWMWLRY